MKVVPAPKPATPKKVPLVYAKHHLFCADGFLSKSLFLQMSTPPTENDTCLMNIRSRRYETPTFEKAAAYNMAILNARERQRLMFFFVWRATPDGIPLAIRCGSF